jgi:hypothetical protein
MGFLVSALSEDDFSRLFALDDAQLQARGAKWYVADRQPGFPCRVSLQDAVPGERVLLVPFTHQPANSPYRASGPVFVREHARQASLDVNEIPALLRLRLLSVRGYDAGGLMVDADVIEGPQLQALIDRLFNDPRVSYLHVHFAKPGCFACRIDRF